MAEVTLGSGAAGGGSTFQLYSAALQQHSSLKSQLQSQVEQVTVLEQLSTFLTLSLPDPESSELVRAARSEAIIARGRANQMVIYVHLHIARPLHHKFFFATVV
jgi:predicted alternative tryptophan synthase beta-subunit